MGERTRSSDGLGLPDGELHRGSRIGKYDILTQLSVGGMAELFLGFTAGPGGFRKYVVVKRILPDVRANEQFLKMFLDEARITAAFNHPNIAQVFDLGEEEDGLFLAMEFISGQNLNQVTRACAQRQESLPIGFTVSVAREVCAALHYAHHFTDPAGRAIPVIHRDVAQKNVMVTYQGVVKLLDFGIAKAKGSLGRTAAGMVKGTTGYMSPEQVRGEEIDGRSDVFAVGVMMHELITGRRLFAADTEIEEMQLILEGPIPKPSQLVPVLPVSISEVVMRALARERADRFESARELGRALERAGGKLSLDQDQRATFMRELFQSKMAAAEALMEAAEEQGTAAALAMKSALQTIREDDGSVFPEAPVVAADLPTGPLPRWPADTRIRLTPASVATPETPVGAADRRQPGLSPGLPADTDIRPALASVTSRAPAAKAKAEAGQRGWLWSLGLLCFTGLAGFIVYLVIMEPELLGGGIRPPSPELSPYRGGPPLADFGGEPTLSASPRTELPPDLALAPDAGGLKAAKASLGHRMGALTLVTIPGCTVLLGKQVVGSTPLFNAALPAGTHMLTLRGEDGRVRLLSVPITAGRTTAFRLKLADLPER